MAWAVDDEPPRLWTPDMSPPSELFSLIEQGAELWAWNVFRDIYLAARAFVAARAA